MLKPVELLVPSQNRLARKENGHRGVCAESVWADISSESN
jgi:hypothetical protein